MGWMDGRDGEFGNVNGCGVIRKRFVSFVR